MALVNTWEHFPKAPITEALLNIEVAFAEPIDPLKLEAFHELIKAQYPHKKRRMRLQTEISIGRDPPLPSSTMSDLDAFMFTSDHPTEGGGMAGPHRVVQVRKTGLTFNWLKPYDSWKALRDEARTHWERYRQTYSPAHITRLGLRYINRLELPLPVTDLEAYVRTAPRVAKGVPQTIAGLFMRLTIPHPSDDLTAIVTETVESPDAGYLPLLFDIDILCMRQREPTDVTIWETFEIMREYKNTIFFESMTDASKEMFR